jgi:hypothetical protein
VIEDGVWLGTGVIINPGVTIGQISLNTRQGTPAATTFAGIERFTTLPAPMTEFWPIVTNVTISTAGHPIHPALRHTHQQFSLPVVIEDGVWLGKLLMRMAQRGVDGMPGGGDSDIWRKHDVIADDNDYR